MVLSHMVITDMTQKTKYVSEESNSTQKIGRRTSPWGNPYKLKKDGGEYTRRESIKKFFMEEVGDMDLSKLKGEKLYCPGCNDSGMPHEEPCHGHVILATLGVSPYETWIENYLNGQEWEKAKREKGIFDF